MCLYKLLDFRSWALCVTACRLYGQGELAVSAEWGFRHGQPPSDHCRSRIPSSGSSGSGSSGSGSRQEQEQE